MTIPRQPFSETGWYQGCLGGGGGLVPFVKLRAFREESSAPSIGHMLGFIELNILKKRDLITIVEFVLINTLTYTRCKKWAWSKM